jgi:DNA topoisomerase VI subunit B
MTATLNRTPFRTSRLLDFLSVKELTAQTGHGPPAWPLVAGKELLDNALDACEEVGIPPEISVTVDEAGISIEDNGPGISATTVSSILDFASRTSSREAYVAPDRGAQGNALKVLAAMPFVLDGEQGRVEIWSQAVRHDISIRVDPIRQEPVIDHRQTACSGQFVKNGTCVRLHWPNSSSPAGGCAPPARPARGDLEETAPGNDHLPSSILRAAKPRFLQIADDFTFLNPHLTLSVDWYGEQTTVKATDPGHIKWVPSRPTSAHWYRAEHLARLIAAYVSHDLDRGLDRTVREFVAEFDGLTATAKQKAVLEMTGMARTNLSGLADESGLKMKDIERLWAAMQAHGRRLKPEVLGLVGRDHISARFAAAGCEMESFQYRKASGERDGVPWVLETAFAWRPEATDRRIITGVNWSPGILNPFRELGSFGESLDSVLERQRAGQNEPVVVLLHLACPRVTFADRGKSSIVIED